MKTTFKTPLLRILSLFLVLILLCAPTAHALNVEQARELLTQYYVDEIPEQVLSRDTIEDILLALGDPYTQYMDAGQYQAFLASMEDSVVVGIGVSVLGNDSGLLIMGIFSGSSAEEAGLTAGDIIVSVDGQSTAGENYETAAAWIRGEEGTQVTLEILHTDGSVQEYSLTRRTVVIPATASEQIDGHICYIVCDTFGAQTLGHFQEGMDAYGEETDHWVVDLRANVGGDMAAAAGTLGLFLGQNNIVYLRDGQGNYGGYASSEASRTMYPVIVLTSPWTASASEIFSLAIRDFEDGLIIGTRTFGKGVAQILLDQDSEPDYFDDGSALKVTAYRYFSPAGNTADKIGVIPHLLVSDENTGNIAWLLCASDPKNENEGVLRLHLGSWRWYLNLAEATSDEMAGAFTELLEALPPQADLFRGVGGGEWEETTAAALASSLGLEINSRSFADAADSPYQAEINTLGTYEIVKGCDDGLFHPEQSLTRAELCALLAQCLNLSPVAGESVFADVPECAWYAPWVNALQEIGLVKGCGDGLFHPDDTIDHEQFITIMARFAAWLNLYLYEADRQGADAETLADDSLARFSDWSKSSVWLLGKSQTNLLGGELNLLFAPVDEIDPSGDTLREEAAALLYSILNNIGILTD